MINRVIEIIAEIPSEAENTFHPGVNNPSDIRGGGLNKNGS
jgi:hypothetical protein